jgi:serine/threonine protein kinase/tetratricopeptide (TPR) repeat protein
MPEGTQGTDGTRGAESTEVAEGTGSRADEPVSSGASSDSTFGRYRLLECIGRGGMAEVFKAKSFGVEGFEKVLVIKRIVPELAVYPQFVEMFVREAKLSVRLSHANIVQVFDLGRVETKGADVPSYFIAMEYVAGIDLATMLAHRRHAKEPMPFGAVAFIAAEVAKALDHAHRRRDAQSRPLDIVHRDISPHNVLLSWDGDVKVTDFGIAKAADAVPKETQPKAAEADENADDELVAVRTTGKVSFMSPEQARAETTDARSDLFSLGVVMYEMIAGANPFSAPTRRETVRRILAGERPPLAIARPDTPQELASITDKLLEVRPEDRFQSAADLCEALLAYAYTSGERFNVSDLTDLVTRLREQPEAQEAAAAAALEEPGASSARTPVEVPQGPVSMPPPASQAIVGERREVTALVLTLGSRSDDEIPQQVIERMRDILERHGAWIEEQTVPQITALFGLGDTDGRDTEAATRAALALIRERRQGAVPSAGIHSGTITVDDGGLPVVGALFAELVRTSQALARATEGQVAVSPVAARLLRRNFALEELSVSDHAVAEGGFVVASAMPTENKNRFVGRHASLKSLGSILGQATRKTPQLVAIRAEPGLGKTRLLSEAERRLARGHFNVAFYAASCPPNGASLPWSGMRAMLHVLCGTQQGDSPQRIVEVKPRLRALGLGDEHVAAVLQLLGAPTRSRASEFRATLRGSFSRMVRSLCRDRLHCFAWDEAQAIDAETLGAILRVSRTRELRGVFILAQHGELHGRVNRREDLHLIELPELTEYETVRLLESQLDVRSIPGELARYVRDRAGGHPLFIEELLRELCDTGSVQVLAGKVTFDDASSSATPRTLKTIITERVSRLRLRQRRVLQGVAVLGEPAFTPVLAALLEQRLPAVDRLLVELADAGLVRRSGPTQVRFASPLYQAIVLDAMPSDSLASLHARAATTYEQFPLSAAADTADRVANHLVDAGQHERAVHFFWQSAEHKLDLGQLEPALRAMMRGLQLADATRIDVDQLVGWIDSIAMTVSQIRNAPGLREVVSDAVRQIEQRGEPRQRALTQIQLARALGSINLFDEAYEALARVATDELDDPDLIVTSLSVEIQIAGRQGLFVRAARACDELDLFGPSDDPDAMLAMAVARAATGDCDVATQLIDRIDETVPPRDDADVANRMKHRLLVHFNARDFAAAAACSSELAALARAAGLRFETAAALHNLGDASDRLGDAPRAYAAFTESLELAKQMDLERIINLNRMHLCLLDGLRGDNEALSRLKSLIRAADAKGFLWGVLEGRYLLARMHHARGQADEARAQCEQVVRMASEQGHILLGYDAERLMDRIDEEAPESHGR